MRCAIGWQFVWQWSRMVALWASAATLVALSVCSCGGSDGGGPGASAPAGVASTNGTDAVSIPLVVGPGSGTGRTFNRARISIEVCAPHDPAHCQHIDHVIVDSGSTGLRLARSALDPALLAALPVKQAGDGRALAECARFATTYLWGTINTVDLRLGPRVAADALVQIVDATSTAPDDCTHQGDWSRLDLLAESSNGIIGLGSVLGDEGRYYVCGASGCDSSAVALPGLQGLVRQPVSLLDADANGYIVELPAVGQGRSASVSGLLVLGIGTHPDNQLGTQAVWPLATNGALGDAVVGGRDLGPLVLDTGLAYHWFDDDRVASCARSGYYCPAAAMTEVVQVRGVTGALGELTFGIANADQRMAVASLDVYADLAHRRDASPGAGLYLGLPFFFGRRVFMGLPGTSSVASNGARIEGPFIAVDEGPAAGTDRLALSSTTDVGGSRGR